MELYYASKSAAQGCDRGKTWLGYCYLNGYGVIENEMNKDFGLEMLHSTADKEEAPDTMARQMLYYYYKDNNDEENMSLYEDAVPKDNE